MNCVMKLRLDPRAKLYILLLGNLTLFFHIDLRAELCLMFFVFSLFFLSGKSKSAIRLMAVYAVMVFAELYMIPIAQGFWLNLLSLFSAGIRMMYPCICTGAYAFSTTTAGEFVCALRRMRVPESIVIPCVVVIRFFPTVAEDYRQIRNAMALRGIAVGKYALVRHPAQSLEYILIPLLMNATNVAQDLTAAALTKGIGLPGRHTSMVEIKLRMVDVLYMVVCTLPFCLFWGGVL